MYVFAFSLMLGATPVFTGCIDNDEPEGITNLRGAKAELLKAKAAVEAARVAEVQANAALINAKAKYQEAKAANEQAQAEINKAIAEQERIKAQILQTKDELKKAELQHQLQVWENEQKEWEAEQAQAALDREHANKEWEVAYNTMLANYEKVLVELAKAKNELAAAQQNVLNPYITRLENAKKAYETAYDKHQTAYYNLVDAQKAVEENEANKEYLTRQLEWNLAEAKAELEGTKKALETAKSELTEAENMQGSELYQKKIALEAQINAIQVELNNLLVSTIENVNKIEADELPAYNEMVAAVNADQNAARKIDAVKIGVQADLFPWESDGVLLDLPEATYTLNNVSASNGVYEQRISDLSRFIDECLSWTRDENDDKWTEEKISKLTYKKNDFDNTTLKTQKELWKEAVEAYQAGEYPSYDPKAIAGYDVLDNMVIAFNKAADDYNAIADEIIANNEAIAAAEEDFNAKHAAAGDVLAEAIKAADKKAADKKAEAPAKKDAAYEAWTATQTAYDKAYAAWQADQTNMEKLQAMLDADKANKAAYENYNKVVAEYDVTAIDAACADEKDKATKECATTQQKAADEFNKIKEEKETAIAALESKRDNELANALQKASDDAVAAFNNYKQRAEDKGNGQFITILTASASDITSLAIPDPTTGKVVGGLSTAALTDMSRDGLKKLVIARSKVLYGKAGKGGVFTEVSDATIMDAVKNTVDPTTNEKVAGQKYFNTFADYGYAGTSLKYQAQIDWANTVVENNKLIGDLVAQAQEASDKLKNEGESALKTWEANVAAVQALAASISDKVAEAWVPYNNKQAELQPVQEVLNAVNSALYNLVGSVSGGTATDLDNYIKNCQDVVAYYEKAVYDAETDVQEKQKLLNDWNAGALSILQTREREYEAAQHDLEVAQSNLAEARANLEAIMEQLSVDGLSE